jgi:uncharacterized protein YgfB (UPF0149 family)
VDAELGTRVEALADWCRGFVLGLGADPERAAALSPDDSRDGGGTTTGRWEVEQRMEQLPRAVSGDGRDAGGRATPGAVAGTSAEAQEILGDLMKIAELSGAEAGDDEDSARAFEEVAEYVRVGAQLLFEEAHPAAEDLT